MKLLKVPVYGHYETAPNLGLNFVNRNSDLDGVGSVEHECSYTCEGDQREGKWTTVRD